MKQYGMSHTISPRVKVAMKYVMVIIASAAAPPLLYGVGLLARVFLMDYFTIPTESMCPTLQPGDKVITNKLTLGGRIYTDFDFDLAGQELKSFRLKGLRRIRHNDIVVFNFPNHGGEAQLHHQQCLLQAGHRTARRQRERSGRALPQQQFQRRIGTEG